MNNFIEIEDTEAPGILSVSLIDLLILLNGTVKKYKWSIYELSTALTENSNFSIHKLDEKISNSKTGLHFDADELLFLAKDLIDTLDLVLVSYEKQEELTAYEEKNSWYLKHDIVIEMVDGYSWEVHAKDPKIIELLGKTYKDTRTETRR